MPHIAIQFPVDQEDQAHLIMALLDEFPVSGFQEETDLITAYCNETDYDEALLKSLLEDTAFTFSVALLEDKNWNEIWESDFEPVYIYQSNSKNPTIVVRASFHPPVDAAKYDLLITPKMSFGTGHHATTLQMMEQMLDLPLQNKSLIDFGTGTGLLAILAEKMGAQKVLAIDNDDWSIENAKENIDANGCSKIDLVKAEVCIEAEMPADVMLANINLNVIVANLPAIKKATSPGGLILFSGILSSDLAILTAAPEFAPIEVLSVAQKNDWLVIKAINHT